MDYERFCDLYAAENADDDTLQEEEVKRFHAEIADERSGYNAVGFSYGSGDQQQKEQEPVESEPCIQIGPRPPPDLEQAMIEPFVASAQLIESMAPGTVMVFFYPELLFFILLFS